VLEGELEILKMRLLELTDAKENLEAHVKKVTGETAAIQEMAAEIA
jgi:hypothetical protein